MLDDKNVIIIQFQMYGLGHIWRKGIRGNNADGTFQLAVALKLATELKKIFPELIMTSQEPCHLPDEIEYLRNRNIHVFERRSFSPDHFINQLSKVKISNQGLMICYMIHFSINDFEDFLAAHWNSEILCRIIFVGNWFLDPIFSEHIKKYKKTKEFCEMVDYRKTLPFEYPNLERNENNFYGFGQWPPYSNHPSDFLSWLSFGNGHIFGISYENAKMLIQKVM
uniref:SRR1-like domain-containing protein n=1 Tax=Panagrolaimus davidi TaxID=227884 RepID=A0A914QYT2_9BILA